MSTSVINQLRIDRAFRLPAPDIAALNQGRTILAISSMFVERGRQFALYPTDIDSNFLPLEEYYHPGFLPVAKESIKELNQEKIKIKVWGKCELCQMLNQPEDLMMLSKVSIWTEGALQKILAQRGHIFLAYFRVYRLPHTLEIPISSDRFIPLPYPIMVDENQVILDNNRFERLYRRLLNRQPPNHPELEELDDQISQLTSPESQFLKDHIEIFLGWQSPKPPEISPELNWINDINKLGNRSQEEDTEKSNYQAGTDFENIVKKSLEFLGFTIDYAHKGGAGGLDLFCSQPYPLVGECKAGKKIPNDTAVQLLNLGTIRLKDENLFKQATKFIIGPGDPTQQLIDAAKVHHIAIINPMTLEKLVKLQAKYPGSVDLIELKKYLQSGRNDERIAEYIDQVIAGLKLRAHIVQVVKEHLHKVQKETAFVSDLSVAYLYSSPAKSLSEKEIHHLLIELSSPLGGYLGRIKDDQGERFYFLRDLIVDEDL